MKGKEEGRKCETGEEGVWESQRGKWREEEVGGGGERGYEGRGEGVLKGKTGAGRVSVEGGGASSNQVRDRVGIRLFG